MSWLDNPLANMYGPHFLLLYAALIVVALSALWYQLHHRDFTAGQPPPPVPTEPDPYEVAYLRGGMEEVARVAVFELLQRGYLSGENGFFEAAENAPDPRYLEGVARAAHNFFSGQSALTAREVFGRRGLVADLRDGIEKNLRLPLEAERLLPTDEVMHSRLRLRVVAAGLVLGLGGYKLIVALSTGYTNVIFLVLLLIAALVTTSVIGLNAPSLTVRGRKYLDALNLAFNQLTADSDTPRASYYLPLLVGLFGVTALGGTSYAYYASVLDQFQRTPRSNVVTDSHGLSTSSSCGSSCGASCGDSCGGGCGGCGG